MEEAGVRRSAGLQAAVFAEAGVDKEALARKLQDEGATSFTRSWNELLARIDAQLASAKAPS